MTRGWFATPLWARVAAGLVLGTALALAWPAGALALAPVGELFVRLIRMLVVPVVLVTVAAGITALGDPRRLGRVGGRAVALFALSTLVAVAVGTAVGLLVRPGEGVGLAAAAPRVLAAPPTPTEQLLDIVPVNLFDALARGDMLAVLFAAVLLGTGTVLAGEAGRPVATLLAGLSAVLLQIVRLVMELTPIGVLALVAGAVAANGAAVFRGVGWLALAVLAGSAVQVAIHAAALAGLARVRVGAFYRNIADALLVAFSTASSSATLPVALRAAEDRLRLDPAVASTVLPLGASIGKDGTAMYVGLMGQFSLQALGVAPDAGMLVAMWLAGALAAFGTAPIPSASLFMLAAMLGTVGVGAEATALVVGLVLPFDRLLDMTRTVLSASANLTVATLVDRAEAR